MTKPYTVETNFIVRILTHSYGEIWLTVSPDDHIAILKHRGTARLNVEDIDKLIAALEEARERI